MGALEREVAVQHDKHIAEIVWSRVVLRGYTDLKDIDNPNIFRCGISLPIDILIPMVLEFDSRTIG